ncbi:MAG: hypothetical protein ABIO02_01500 [Patescibacteria group bacterium]
MTDQNFILTKLREKYKLEKAVVRVLEKHTQTKSKNKVYKSMMSLLRESKREVDSIKTKLSY